MACEQRGATWLTHIVCSNRRAKTQQSVAHYNSESRQSISVYSTTWNFKSFLRMLFLVRSGHKSLSLQCIHMIVAENSYQGWLKRFLQGWINFFDVYRTLKNWEIGVEEDNCKQWIFHQRSFQNECIEVGEFFYSSIIDIFTVLVFIPVFLVLFLMC